MTEQMVAYCGLICTDCNAYKATQTNDNDLRRQMANEWGSPEWPVDPADISCDGCKGNGRHFKFCAQCQVRNCASNRGVETCAHCADYGCEIIEKFLGMMTDNKLRETLDGIRKAL
ncbi:MAG: DUF3795 domain-containing protein [Promethearchaeota archaeon]